MKKQGKIELDIDSMIEILHKNFGFKKVEDPFGCPAIQMSSRDAFRYSLIQGSPFLVDEYGVTLKEQLKVFYHRSSLNENYYLYCPGLFGVKRDRETLLLDKGNASVYMKKNFRSMFSRSIKKIIIFYEYDPKGNESRAEIERKVYEQILKENKEPKNYLLTIVRTDNKQKESFLEYVACEFFNRKGYLTETQVPFQNNRGIPDFAAYKIKDEHMKILSKYKLIDGGCCLPEISAAKSFISNKKYESPEPNTEYEMNIGEAKIGIPYTAKGQLKKYANTKISKHLFSITPNPTKKTTSKRKPAKNKSCKYGEFYFDDEFNINYNPITIATTDLDKQKIKNDEEFLLNYIKLYALGNLPLEKIKSSCQIKENQKSESEQLIAYVKQWDFEKLIKFVGEEM